MRMTLSDVAREAGVSLATVDRVINRRPGVSTRSVTLVEQTLEKLGYRPDPLAARLARRSLQRFCFVLPAGNNTFMRLLAGQVEQARNWLADQRAIADVVWTDVFDPAALAETLERIDDRYEGVAVVALDHPMVREAIDALDARGIDVVTLVSDVPASRRAHFVGIDNSAAGRTAATLLGRFAGGRNGPVAVLAGSLSLRDHAERIYGFQQVLASEYGALAILPVREGRDDVQNCRTVVAALLAGHPDLVGIYNAGAGNRGVAEALESAGRARDVIFVGHELTPHSRRFLMRGTMDAVINQDPGHEARSAARVLMARGLKQPIVADQERIRIDIFVRDNLP
ncbi:MAG TPA: LacI family DNA-binding transcriptional regulator [Dongiaceae bacterium]|nr:LacI family DNA-binding transcriptional regulator [Dongiaceae bacterium]